MTIDPTKKYEALMKTTVGSIQIELYADKTPITVNNFIYLARNNFYQNIEFHRVIKDFFIQTGDPTGTGTGNPGYTIKDERFEGEYVKGMVAMANTDRANSSGSQFFIMHGNVPIEKTYPIFGKVIKGLEIIDKIANAPVKPEGDASSPVNPVKILSISITEK